MDERTEEHIERVFQWLEENVKKYPTPKKVTLTSFEVEWSKLRGSFRLLLNDQEVPKKFTFGITQSGTPEFYPPIFHSPLGAPASYRAVELTESTSDAIRRALRRTIPRVMAFGIDRGTGKEIFSQTPMQDRILDKEEFERTRARVSEPGYSITVETSSDPNPFTE